MQLARRLLHPHFRIAALLGRPASPVGRVGEPFGGDGEVAFELAERDPDAAEFIRDCGAMPFRRVAPVYRRFADTGDFGKLLPLAGQQLGQLGVATLEILRVLRELLEAPSRERERDGKLFLGERAVALGLALLPRERADLRLHLGDEILEALQVGRGFLEAARRGVAAVAIQADAGRLLEQRAALVGAIREQQVDHLGFDDHAGVAAEPGAAQQVLDVPQPRRRVVEQIVALARTRQAPSDHDFAVRGGKLAVAVVEVERHFGDVDRAPGRRALEDHVFHLAAAQQPRRLLAEYPAHCVGNVRLAATIGADNRGHAWLE